MRRRELLLLLGGAITAPDASRAQQKAVPVIDLLGSTSRGAPFVAAFLEGLAETGYVEGQNAAIEYRWAEGRYDRLPALAAELVKRGVDMIVTQGGIPPTLAAKSATSMIQSGVVARVVPRSRTEITMQATPTRTTLPAPILSVRWLASGIANIAPRPSAAINMPVSKAE